MAPLAFQKVIATILSGIDGTINYLDNIVVSGASQSIHDTCLQLVLQHLECHRVILNYKKSMFNQPSIEFLGFCVSKNSVQPVWDKVHAIASLSPPQNSSDLASILGMVNYYAKFIQRYGDITEPLHQLLCKNSPWNWSVSCQQAFETLKKWLSEAPMLAHYDPALTTIVTCDSSVTAMGTVLLQVHPDGERPVAFISQTLSAAERKYSAGKHKSLAYVWASQHWHLYLFDHKFTLKTDHQALTTLLATKGSRHKPLHIYRWSDHLHQYHF